MLKRFKGWRTLATNMALFVPLAVDLALALNDNGLGQFIPVQYQTLYGVLIVLANTWLRFQTTTPVGVRDE